MLKRIINYLRNNQVDCCANARNDIIAKLAFTLAETLIVMGIIGVVAALTLPNLNSSTGDKEKVAKLQKIYSNLNDAFGRAEAVYGPFDEWCSGLSNDNCNKRFFERITEFMKYSKVCTISDSCTLFDSGNSSEGNRAAYSVILADGSTIGFKIEYYSNTSLSRLRVHIDLDGMSKGANRQCHDYFQVYILPKKGLTYSTNENSQYSAFCTAWILRNGNMDYLKTTQSDQIGGKCPDNKTILNWTTNTTCK